LRKAQAEHTYREHAKVFDDFAATVERSRAVKANAPFHRLRVESRNGKPLNKKHWAATTWALP